MRGFGRQTYKRLSRQIAEATAMDKSKHIYICTNGRCTRFGIAVRGLAPEMHQRLTGRATECDLCGRAMRWLRKEEETNAAQG